MNHQCTPEEALEVVARRENVSVDKVRYEITRVVCFIR